MKIHRGRLPGVASQHRTDWHGAAADTLLVHLAVSLGETRWRDEVAEDLYRRVSDAANRA